MKSRELEEIAPQILRSTNNSSLSYELVSICGSGASGTVYIANQFVDEDLHEYQVAIKKFKRLKPEQIKALNALIEYDFVQIQNIHDFFEEKETSEWCIVMDLAYTNLEKFIMGKIYKSMNSAKKYELFQQIVYGVYELHSRELIHRDIKPLNIVISQSEKAITAKICDFDTIRFLDAVAMTANAGTYMFMAPEFIDSQNYTEKVDIWSLGTVFFYMIDGFHFIDADTVEQQKLFIKNLTQEQLDRFILERTEKFSDFEKKLLQKIFKIAHQDRPSAKELDSYIAEFISSDKQSQVTQDEGPNDFQVVVDKQETISILSNRQETKMDSPLLQKNEQNLISQNQQNIINVEKDLEFAKKMKISKKQRYLIRHSLNGDFLIACNHCQFQICWIIQGQFQRKQKQFNNYQLCTKCNCKQSDHKYLTKKSIVEAERLNQKQLQKIQ